MTEEKPKEKSVLTDLPLPTQEVMDYLNIDEKLWWASCKGKGEVYEIIVKAYRYGFLAEQERALANYKKELREKVQERLDLIKGDEGRYREGQESVFLWLLRELGDG